MWGVQQGEYGMGVGGVIWFLSPPPPFHIVGDAGLV